MTTRENRVRRQIEKLSLGPKDIIIVRDHNDMNTLIDMTQRGIGFSEYANPVLYIPGGLEKATEQDLLDALRLAREVTENAGRIITAVN